jgi:hypothetical protein
MRFRTRDINAPNIKFKEFARTTGLGQDLSSYTSCGRGSFIHIGSTVARSLGVGCIKSAIQLSVQALKQVLYVELKDPTAHPKYPR